MTVGWPDGAEHPGRDRSHRRSHCHPYFADGTLQPGLTWPQEAMLTTIAENPTTVTAEDDGSAHLPESGAHPDPQLASPVQPMFTQLSGDRYFGPVHPF
jgi:hypothetical protein